MENFYARSRSSAVTNTDATALSSLLIILISSWTSKAGCYRLSVIALQTGSFHFTSDTGSLGLMVDAGKCSSGVARTMRVLT